MKLLANKVTGFTTNPTLIKAAGVSDYESFASECVASFPDHSLSFEVISDDIDSMRKQAYKIASWGENVYVKIPIMTTDEIPTTHLIEQLCSHGIKVNVTAVFTKKQILQTAEALEYQTPSYVSIFAGRIADSGVDPQELIRFAFYHCPENVEILWASTREAFNVCQAEAYGADIITLTPELIGKLSLSGKDLTQFSLETVKMFYQDAIAAGLSL